MTRYLTITFFILLFTCLNITGQVSEESETQSGDLTLRIKNINFVKDNEYFNDIRTSRFMLISSLPAFVDKSLWIEGYTLVGFFFQPELVYSPSEKVTIRAGTHFLKYAGLTKFSQIKPIFSATLNLTEHTSLTIGSLSGSDRHQLFDPHFNSERLYSNYSEDGFQVTTSNDHIFNDNWLSWENFIIKGDSTREIFTVGESFKYTSYPVADFLQFEVPVQLQFKHFGGQISNFPEHVETYFNLATGVRVNIDVADRRYGQAGIEYLQFINGEFPSKPISGITHGYASWYRFHYTFKTIYFGLYYWKSHNFFAPNGNSLYGSVIDTRSKYVIPDRKIITNAIFVTLMPESYLGLYLGVESYYDVCLKRMDNSITLHLNFDKLIKLATLKH
ncbi:MAG TPA: hypothetical protein VMV77_06905 [Bacteroidales bacterium]|nr:hypothetical protein [Bacteroidales bacterium]